jgi:hypothetical protein
VEERPVLVVVPLRLALIQEQGRAIVRHPPHTHLVPKDGLSADMACRHVVTSFLLEAGAWKSGTYPSGRHSKIGCGLVHAKIDHAPSEF